MRCDGCGVAVPTPCAECLEARRLERVAAIPGVLRRMGFSPKPAERPDGPAHGWQTYISGPPGGAVDHVAAGVARGWLLGRARTAAWDAEQWWAGSVGLTVAAMLDEARAAAGDTGDREWRRPLLEARLLVLHGLGLEPRTSWGVLTLGNFLAERLARGEPFVTVITGLFRPDELKDVYQDHGVVAAVIRGTCECVTPVPVRPAAARREPTTSSPTAAAFAAATASTTRQAKPS